MRTTAGCAAQIVLLLVLASLIAAPLACVATLTAPLHSPGCAAQVLCPPGSQLESEWYESTYNQPGERTLSATCVDSQGQPVAANPQDERTLLNGARLYFPVCFAPVLVLGALLLLAVNASIRARRPRTARPGPPV